MHVTKRRIRLSDQHFHFSLFFFPVILKDVYRKCATNLDQEGRVIKFEKDLQASKSLDTENKQEKVICKHIPAYFLH